jgi:hypothetical protein
MRARAIPEIHRTFGGFLCNAGILKLMEEETQQVEEPVKEEKWHTPLARATSLSKYFAMVLFVVLPFVGFWLGMEYASHEYTGVVVQRKTNPPVTERPVPESAIELPTNNHRFAGEEGGVVVPNLSLLPANVEVSLEKVQLEVIVGATSSKPIFIPLAMLDESSFSSATVIRALASDGVSKILLYTSGLNELSYAVSIPVFAVLDLDRLTITSVGTPEGFRFSTGIGAHYHDGTFFTHRTGYHATSSLGLYRLDFKEGAWSRVPDVEDVDYILHKYQGDLYIAVETAQSNNWYIWDRASQVFVAAEKPTIDVNGRLYRENGTIQSQTGHITELAYRYVSTKYTKEVHNELVQAALTIEEGGMHNGGYYFGDYPRFENEDRPVLFTEEEIVINAGDIMLILDKELSF